MLVLAIVAIILYVVFKVTKSDTKKYYHENGVLSCESKTYQKDGNITRLYKYYSKEGKLENRFIYENKKKTEYQNNPSKPLQNNILASNTKNTASSKFIPHIHSKQNPAHPIKITEINNSIPSVLLDKSLENITIGTQIKETIVKKKEASPSKIKIERLQEAKDKELRLRNELKSKESELEKTKRELEYLKLTIASTQSSPKPQIQNSTKVDDGKIVSRESFDDF